MPKRILVLNGPNLNMLGIREPKTYGSQTLADIEAMCKAEGKRLKLTVECKQSNREGELCEWIQAAYGKVDGIVINPAGYTHTSVAILDALLMIEAPIIEVHISDIQSREPFRRHSYVSQAARVVISGEGIDGYAHAIGELAATLGAETRAKV